MSSLLILTWIGTINKYFLSWSEKIMEDKKLRIFQVLNILGTIVVLTINALANILPINGKNTGELSDAIPNLFVPVGLTFSIWGVIYTLLILFSIYQIVEKEDTEFLGKIGIFYTLSNIGNFFWILAWHYQIIWLSLLLMFVILGSLLGIYLRLDIGREEVSTKQKVLVHLPFSVYLGWITIATIANVTALAVTVGWDGFGISEELWTILVIIVAIIITSLMLFTRKDVGYSLVVIWASYGIYLKRIADYPTIAYTALAAIIIISALIVVVVIKYKKY